MNPNPNNIEAVKQAFVLLAIGMGITYVFMYSLVLVMRALAKIIPRFDHLLPDAE